MDHEQSQALDCSRPERRRTSVRQPKKVWVWGRHVTPRKLWRNYGESHMFFECEAPLHFFNFPFFEEVYVDHFSKHGDFDPQKKMSEGHGCYSLPRSSGSRGGGSTGCCVEAQHEEQGVGIDILRVYIYIYVIFPYSCIFWLFSISTTYTIWHIYICNIYIYM